MAADSTAPLQGDYQTVTLHLPGNQATGDDTIFVAPEDIIIIDAIAAVGTAPATTALIYDIDVGATTIIDAITIAASGTVSSLTAATTANAAVSAGSVVVCDTKQIGTGTVGANAAIVLRYVPAGASGR